MGGRGCGCEGECDARARRRCCDCRAPYDCAGHWDYYPTCECSLVERRRCDGCDDWHRADELDALGLCGECAACCAEVGAA